jgi:hypothetical protein
MVKIFAAIAIALGALVAGSATPAYACDNYVPGIGCDD